MCTTIAERTPLPGSAKGPDGWFKIGQLYVSYDHPVHASVEHAILLDLVDESAGPGARVAVELDRSAAREMIERLQHALECADRYEGDPVPSG